jgi:hypothetical protein
VKATNGLLELGSSIFIDSKNLKFPDEIMKIKKFILIGSSDYRGKSSRIVTYEIRIFFRPKDSPEKKKSNDKDKNSQTCHLHYRFTWIMSYPFLIF